MPGVPGESAAANTWREEGGEIIIFGRERKMNREPLSKGQNRVRGEYRVQKSLAAPETEESKQDKKMLTPRLRIAK